MSVQIKGLPQQTIIDDSDKFPLQDGSSDQTKYAEFGDMAAKVREAQEAAWASWTPGLYNILIGNGTITGKKKIIGKTGFAPLRILFGSTTVMGSNPTF